MTLNDLKWPQLTRIDPRWPRFGQKKIFGNFDFFAISPGTIIFCGSSSIYKESNLQLLARWCLALIARRQCGPVVYRRLVGTRLEGILVAKVFWPTPDQATCWPDLNGRQWAETSRARRLIVHSSRPRWNVNVAGWRRSRTQKVPRHKANWLSSLTR